jgi:hypothetical protein
MQNFDRAFAILPLPDEHGAVFSSAEHVADLEFVPLDLGEEPELRNVRVWIRCFCFATT